jgi:enoyl-CoA hydratase/carnithine racemase
MNFMNGPMFLELAAFLDEIENDPESRAVVFTGGLPNVFITHHDVNELVALSEADLPEGELPKAVDMPHHQLMLRMERLPKVTIAAINGACGGGGCEFALACDFRIMAIGPFAIGLPEVGIGILPGGGGTQRLPRVVGQAKALELMLMGKTVGAEEAERIGLVHKAVPAIELMSTVLTLAQRLANGANVAQGLIKRCVYEGSVLPLEQGLQVEMESFAQTLATDDAQRAMKAYVSGRLFEFSGR